MSIDDENYNFLEQKIKDLEDNYRFNLLLLEQRITELEETGKKKKRKERNDKMNLELAKSQFIEDDPRNRTDPFSDTDLAFWALFLLSKTNRKETITTWAELGKRKKLAKNVVNYFIEKGHTEDEARQLAKDYLEMVLTQYPTFKSKDGETNMGYFTATSDFAIGYYSQRMGNWKQVKNLPDESLD